MKMIKKENLKRNYEKACNDYLQYFCKVYEFYYDPYYWVGGQVGTIVCVDDYYFSLEAGGLGFSTINLSSWVKGAPRKSEEELEKVRILQYCKTSLEIEIEKLLKL
jgi:hypothetical protein